MQELILSWIDISEVIILVVLVSLMNKKASMA